LENSNNKVIYNWYILLKGQGYEFTEFPSEEERRGPIDEEEDTGLEPEDMYITNGKKQTKKKRDDEIKLLYNMKGQVSEETGLELTKKRKRSGHLEDIERITLNR
jgi:hypothetical protein